jgi:hypothetical protein
MWIFALLIVIIIIVIWKIKSEGYSGYRGRRGGYRGGWGGNRIYGGAAPFIYPIFNDPEPCPPCPIVVCDPCPKCGEDKK